VESSNSSSTAPLAAQGCPGTCSQPLPVVASRVRAEQGGQRGAAAATHGVTICDVDTLALGTAAASAPLPLVVVGSVLWLE
jgi:hypothetical protein